jgi:hypothetical protein
MCALRMQIKQRSGMAKTRSMRPAMPNRRSVQRDQNFARMPAAAMACEFVFELTPKSPTDAFA